MKNNFSRLKSIQKIEKKASTIKEDIMSEIEVEDEVRVVVMDEVVISTTTNRIIERKKLNQRTKQRQSKI